MMKHAYNRTLSDADAAFEVNLLKLIDKTGVFKHLFQNKINKSVMIFVQLADFN